jgi:ADP-glucose pyrophosphorylase
MEFLILAGDHLYRMDYEKFIQAHRETDADITVAALPMDEARATAFGLMKIDEEGRIIEFAEKPKGEQLKAMMVHIMCLSFQANLIYICGQSFSKPKIFLFKMPSHHIAV